MEVKKILTFRKKPELSHWQQWVVPHVTICKNSLANTKYNQSCTDILPKFTSMGFIPRTRSGNRLRCHLTGALLIRLMGDFTVSSEVSTTHTRKESKVDSPARHHPAFGAKGKMSSREHFQTFVHGSHFHSLALSSESVPAIHCFLPSFQSPQADLLASVLPLALSVCPKKPRKLK